nr:MAG: hypothetical protein DIU57_05265 [Pseudomonadota bacterium]
MNHADFLDHVAAGWSVEKRAWRDKVALASHPREARRLETPKFEKANSLRSFPPEKWNFESEKEFLSNLR